MITIHDLLEDERYKAFLCKVPSTPDHLKTPWRLAVQIKPHGPWGYKDYEDYRGAFRKLKVNLARINDAAIISKSIPFEPPNKTVRVKGKFFFRGDEKLPVTKRIPWAPILPPEEPKHHWCPYCRRPTIFTTFIVHPALSRRLDSMDINPFIQRCTICGSSENIVNLKR